MKKLSKNEWLIEYDRTKPPEQKRKEKQDLIIFLGLDKPTGVDNKPNKEYNVNRKMNKR